MTISNYTGADVGLTDKDGIPIRVLSSVGKAEVVAADYELQKVDNLLPIYRKRRGIIKYLPQPDGNLQKMYIVNRDVAEAGRLTRMDLLIVDDMFTVQGGKFYRKLVNM
jgi:hypothetical protein